jgi:hypothetical protein
VGLLQIALDQSVRLCQTKANMVHGERTERIALRLSPEEAQVVADVSAETGLSLSDVVRQAIRTAHAERFGPKAKQKPKRK